MNKESKNNTARYTKTFVADKRGVNINLTNFNFY